ncbi:glycosyl hydrolase family 18 protein [Pectinatus haikarae]|uniref:Spore germination protein YaaH n=1 Tax=Pectinatus haikarae TaxID=349096 RepID=A0ABT9YAN1_9FIRM|nr:glycosyl hydrolase family 18 protein [Pectinatus haikarae]MDQ0204703.1 spore germination protein YaaH [Pectinatus haikarae]
MKRFLLFFFFCSIFVSTACAADNKGGVSAGKKINMVWQPVFEQENNFAMQPKIEGINIISPSWLAVTSANGFIKNNIDENYMKNAHEKGYEIWPLVSNNFDKDLTHAFLHDEKARAYIIRQLLFYAQKYKFDGYNFDFENIYEGDKDILSLFIAQASAALRKEGLRISMDVTVPSENSAWSKCYNREELAKHVDYLILMAYDEHSRLSPVSGSIASLSWVEEGIRRTLDAGVPREKLILGVPLYMRLWKEENGKTTAKTLSMQEADELIMQYDIQPEWLQNEGQFYFEYRKGAGRYRVWQENAASLRLKLTLIKKYDLPGAASWRKGFETADIWSLFDNELNK